MTTDTCLQSDASAARQTAPARRARANRQRRRCYRWRGLAIALACLAIFFATSASSCAATEGTNANHACGPFGNPPADLIEAETPSCWGGKLLGPWNDSNGTARYACLYEPTPVEGLTRRPMVVYLHPFVFGVETIRLTNLLHYQDSVSLRGDRKKGRHDGIPGQRGRLRNRSLHRR